MKKFSKILSVALLVALVLSFGAMAFADEATNNQVVDASVSVSGLENGDTVNFIQVIEWVDGTGWAYVDGLAAAATAAGVELPTLNTITGYYNTTTEQLVEGAISADHAAILAKAAAKLNGTPYQATADATTKTATYPNAPAGLYYAQVIPATADYLYNTIFVGADFTSDNATNTIAANTATVGGETNAIAKKEQVTLTKDSNGSTDDIKYDHDLGEVIPFTITSKVPAYAAGYVNPQYVISDTIEAGLALCKSNGDAATASDINVVIEDITLAAGDYTTTLADDGLGFSVALTSTGLDKVAATGVAKTITITYNAKITSLENATVTEKTNTATVKFSNKPTDESSYSLLEDRTRHYSFSIDANLLGYTGTSYETDELIKVALDADGNPLTETKKYHSGTTWSEQSPLQGATFALFTSSPADADVASVAAAQTSEKIYKNPGFNGVVESDANGRLNITGLDEGTYYLKEISAPAGYIKDSRTFAITIAATYTEIEAGSYTKTIDNNSVTVNYGAYKVLDGYTVTVNDGIGNVVSTYEIVNAGPNENKVVDKATYQTITGEDFAGDTMTPISNTKGTALPSTGGIGTTIFYIVGGVLVLAAIILLVTKKRMSE